MTKIKDIKQTLVNFLARRDHSQFELRYKLKLRGFEDNAIEEALVYAQDLGYQSDALFAKNYVQMRKSRGFGPLYIEQELKTHGISYEIMQQSLDQNDQNWIELACHVRQKRFGAKKPIHFNDKAKQLQFLKYRGFTPEQIKAALEGEDY